MAIATITVATITNHPPTVRVNTSSNLGKSTGSAERSWLMVLRVFVMPAYAILITMEPTLVVILAAKDAAIAVTLSFGRLKVVAINIVR
mmetsp:Transcript_40831/g.49046  ORF Transcript_40831/g.49046 Transcript_40831/m.49046 type:complete len:89 (+) Transcript_40831:686-952(+)